MSSQPIQRSPVLRDYLESTEEAAGKSIETRISTALTDQQGKRLTPTPRRRLVHELVNALSDLTDIPLLDVAAAGWRKCDELEQAAQDSLRSADSKLVDVLTHQITSTHQPYVEVILDGAVVEKITFDIQCVLLIRALTVRIRQGRITALQSGQGDLTGTVRLNEFEIAHLKGHLSLPLALQLGEGIALVKP